MVVPSLAGEKAAENQENRSSPIHSIRFEEDYRGAEGASGRNRKRAQDVDTKSENVLQAVLVKVERGKGRIFLLIDGGCQADGFDNRSSM